MLYELWIEDDPGSSTDSFFSQNNDQAREFLSPTAQLLWTTEASTLDDAYLARNEHLGWEPDKRWAF